jgi:hypothetical protein
MKPTQAHIDELIQRGDVAALTELLNRIEWKLDDDGDNDELESFASYIRLTLLDIDERGRVQFALAFDDDAAQKLRDAIEAYDW